MFLQAGQGNDQGIDKGIANFSGWPLLENPQVKDMPDHRKAGPDIGADVNVAGNYFHRFFGVFWISGIRIQLETGSEDVGRLQAPPLSSCGG